jgi:CIC family chloride channel protein
MTLAGMLTGLLALLVPEILSIGYDTVNDTLLGNLELSLLLTILAGKLLATALGLGLGLPGGVIGPCLMMGALAGGATGTLLAITLVDHASAPSLYAMLGMGAMMGATLNAPLTALITLVELTVNPHIILPGMLAIIAAELTSHYAFGTPSVFKALMQTRGLSLSYSSDPLSQFLRRLGVTHAMNRQVMRLPAQLPQKQLPSVILAQPSWILIHGAEGWLLAGDEVLSYLENQQLTPNETVDLTTLSVRQVSAVAISSQATLEAALRKMNKEKAEALYVKSPRDERVLGVVTRTDIERSYRLPLN